MINKYSLLLLAVIMPQVLYSETRIVSESVPMYDFPVAVSLENSAVSGMSHIVVKENVAFGSQVSQPNTVYEIRYSFDLGGKSVVIPEGCVLYLLGGSLSNGIIVGQNTDICYIAGILNCVLDGSFTNESIHMEWFGIASGKKNVSNNDRIMKSFVIPSLENTGNTLYMGPQTEMFFSKPLVFNGTYDLDLRGRLCYTGVLVSTAVSIGTPNTKTSGKTYKIHSVSAAPTTSFFNKGKVEENVGVCLWNLKQCNITLDEVQYFSYCIRLCGNIAGCSSNTIYFTRIGGNCYYGIHCCSYDSGWVNENTFYGKTIMNYSSNPAKDAMCAIWLDARGSNSCNSNVFYAPCVENCHIVVRQTNARYNVIYDARAESIGQAILSEGKSRDNTLYCKYWDRKGDYSSYGSNRVIKQSEIIPPLVQVCSKQVGVSGGQYYGVCFDDSKLRARGQIDGGFVFGTIVDIADPNKDANVELVFEQPGRFCIVFLNDDYTFKSLKRIDDYLLQSNVNSTRVNGEIRGSLDARRIAIQLSKKSGKMIIGTYSSSSIGDVIAMSVYSDNLLVDELYTSNKDAFILMKDSSIDAFYYEGASNHFLSSIGSVQVRGRFDLKKKVLDLSKKQITIENKGGFTNGSIDVSGSTIYPNYNALIEGSGIVVRGIPAAGTLYIQGGKPTWSNGSSWVDANGQVIR